MVAAAPDGKGVVVNTSIKKKLKNKKRWPTDDGAPFATPLILRGRVIILFTVKRMQITPPRGTAAAAVAAFHQKKLFKRKEK